MKNLRGIIIEGQKLGMEQIPGKNNKVITNLHVLNGYESVKLSVRDANIEVALRAIPDNKTIKVKAEVQTYKDELYLQVLSVVA
jgi:hypothetical protein